MEAPPLNLYHVQAPATARVISNTRITALDCDEVRHIVLDRAGLDFQYVEGQSLGILTPGTDESGRPNKLRLFSIASGRQGDDGRGQTVSICVKRVVYRDPETGELKQGVASNFLCGLEPGDTVAITGPVGNRFLLPQNSSANLILVATGTGVAPCRSFLAHAFASGTPWRGQVYLFFGCKNQGECLYQREFETYRAHPNFHFVTARSREEQSPGGERMYVDHRVAERVAELWELLRGEDTYLYVCGIKGTEGGVFRVLEAHASEEGVSWPDLQKELLKTRRICVETY